MEVEALNPLMANIIGWDVVDELNTHIKINILLENSFKHQEQPEELAAIDRAFAKLREVTQPHYTHLQAVTHESDTLNPSYGAIVNEWSSASKVLKETLSRGIEPPGIVFTLPDSSPTEIREWLLKVEVPPWEKKWVKQFETEMSER